MVDKTDEKQVSGQGKRFDWIAIYDGWRLGQSAEGLAQTFGLKPSTITMRCSWLDQHFPPCAPRRRLAELNLLFDRAQADLESGDLAQAERRAKAVTALIRAGRALQDWSEHMNTDVSDQTGAPDRETASSDTHDYRAELAARLHRLGANLQEKSADCGDHRSKVSGGVPASAQPLADLGET